MSAKQIIFYLEQCIVVNFFYFSLFLKPRAEANLADIKTAFIVWYYHNNKIKNIRGFSDMHKHLVYITFIAFELLLGN